MSLFFQIFFSSITQANSFLVKNKVKIIILTIFLSIAVFILPLIISTPSTLGSIIAQNNILSKFSVVFFAMIWFTILISPFICYYIILAFPFNFLREKGGGNSISHLIKSFIPFLLTAICWLIAILLTIAIPILFIFFLAKGSYLPGMITAMFMQKTYIYDSQVIIFTVMVILALIITISSFLYLKYAMYITVENSNIRGFKAIIYSINIVRKHFFKSAIYSFILFIINIILTVLVTVVMLLLSSLVPDIIGEVADNAVVIFIQIYITLISIFIFKNLKNLYDNKA